jgi:small GTP-binding protein
LFSKNFKNHRPFSGRFLTTLGKKTMRTFKIVIAGNGRVGKSSLVHRYVAGQFNRSYTVTIGADFASREVELEDETIRLVIWDLAGQRRFHVVRDGFYRGAKVVILVFDITNQQSWDALPLWTEEITQRVPAAQIVIVGNKADLEHERVIPRSAAHRWAQQRRYGYLETSCATGAAVDDLFVGVAHLAVSIAPPSVAPVLPQRHPRPAS